jgi:Cof subfamily protein (haloacid dehalogenase superfamily)
MFRVIASDLDGTLLGVDERVSARTERVLRAARAAGIFVVAATGRTLLSALPLLPEGAVDLIITDNGASVYDPLAGRIKRLRVIDPHVARSTFAAVRVALPMVGFGWATPDGVWLDQTFLDLGYQLSERSSARMALEIHDQMQITKLFIVTPDLRQVALQRALEELQLEGVVVSTSGAPFVEASVAGCDKATTLAGVTEELGLSADDVIAFGDQMNDIAMLSWVGRGVAMGNAHAEVRAIAQQQTASNREDGVALVLEQLFGI